MTPNNKIQLLVANCKRQLSMVKEDNHFYDCYVIIMANLWLMIKKVYQKKRKTKNKTTFMYKQKANSHT